MSPAAKPATVHELDEGAAEAAEQTPDPVKGLAALRVPFRPEEVGKLPKPYKKDAQRGTCDDCGKYHGLPAMHLDFVGHGHVTKRLLDVDPEWSWEPFALDAQGLPALDKWGNLWIRLTVCGVTRIGVGDGASMKVLIGDALRNAAMRFGVALDLWAHGSEDEKQDDNESMPQPAFQWTVAATKARLVELLDGDKTKAAEAWRTGGGDNEPPGAELADRLAALWLENQPAEPDGGGSE